MCLVRQCSLSSNASLPKAAVPFSACCHRMTLPSSPADANVSPVVVLLSAIVAEIVDWEEEAASVRTLGRPSNNIDGLRMFDKS